MQNIDFITIITSLTFLYGFPTAALLKLEGIRALKAPLRYMKREITIIGHRGAPGYAPENTLTSIEKAVELGVDMIEVDARITKDKKVVIIHDPTVDRTTNGKGNVNNLTLKQIKKLNIGEKEKIPTLQEVISLLKRKKSQLNIHIKEHAAADQVVKIVKKNNFQRKTIISSFAEITLEKVKELSPNIRIAYVFAQPRLQYIKIGKKLDVYALHPVYPTLTERLIIRAHKNGFKVNVWTIKNNKQAWKSKIYGVDGIISDDPLLYTKKNNSTT
ncbi:hypothetical protein KY332_04135, partial [Candidatus Woesearchaeota archaeon]|nr:hypothetical protein [Candidatus Woesearchaeota archaeon]